MPLFTYKCLDCEFLMEKFQHDGGEVLEIECENCKSTNCEKLMPFAHNRVWLDSKELYNQKIAPDAKRIMDNMKKGNDSDFFDIYGDK